MGEVFVGFQIGNRAMLALLRATGVPLESKNGVIMDGTNQQLARTHFNSPAPRSATASNFFRLFNHQPAAPASASPITPYVAVRVFDVPDDGAVEGVVGERG